MNVGILALQGDFERHSEAISDLGARPRLIRTADELEGIDALILPGGESTTLQTLIDGFGLRSPLLSLGDRRVPIMGTCAGLILLAREVSGRPEIRPLRLIDVSVDRNAYGRQLESFEAPIQVNLGEEAEALGIFIRAPRISRVGEGVRVLGTLRGEPVVVREGRILGLTFHPELSEDRSFHRYFLSMTEG
jgi:5'-phosphate synthase pdxT subunit